MEEAVKIRIFDTTLREGEQSPGATMTTEEKVQVAEQLARLNVDIIEAGFPAASYCDLVAVKEVARRVRGSAIAGLARAHLSDIDAAWEAVREAEYPVIHVFLSTSDVHLQHKLRISREEALQRIRATVAYARKLCPTVEFSAVDATRSDLEYLCRVCETLMRVGVTTINLPDSVGYALPQEYEGLFRSLRERVPGIENVTLSAHCHDDLGMATANTLAAIKGGARQVEVTINGLGERAGNAATEEVVMALRTRPQAFNYADTRIHAQELLATSQLVSRLTGMLVQPNKAIIGANAFAPDAWTLQDGRLRNRLRYEMITPQAVGWPETKPLLGKHAARYELDARLRKLGHRLNAEQLKVAYTRFITLAEQKKQVTDADLVYIVESSQETPAAV